MLTICKFYPADAQVGLCCNKVRLLSKLRVHIMKLVSKDNTHPEILIQDLNKYLKFKVCI